MFLIFSAPPIEEIEFDEETKRAKHCQLWKVPLPEIKYGKDST